MFSVDLDGAYPILFNLYNEWRFKERYGSLQKGSAKEKSSEYCVY